MTEYCKWTSILKRSEYVSMLSQLTFTCSKSIIETVEKGVKYVQS